MESTAKREDLGEIRVLIESTKVLIERKESTMLRWLIGILATSIVAIAVAVIRSFT